MQASGNTYHEFLRSLRQALSFADFASAPAITVIFGPSDYLRDKAAAAIKGWASETMHATCINMETKDIADNQWEELFLQSSLLDPKAMYFVRATDKLAGFFKFLDTLKGPSSQLFVSRLVLVVSQKDLLKSARTKLEKTQAQLICCTGPRPNEEPKFATDLARKFGLNLDTSAVTILLQALGHDNFHALENEIRKLAMVYVDRDGSSKPLTAADLAPHLQLLREEDVFQIDQLMLNGKSSQAQLLLLGLLQRGEAPIAIIGIIARHCRNSIRVINNLQGLNDRPPSLPVPVLRSYTQYVRRKSVPHFQGVLRKCQMADVQFKTSPIDPGLLISELIQDLRSPGFAN